jgi:ABC-type thiamine transport system ATPase subunit
MLMLKLWAAAGRATEVAARARAGMSSFLIMVVSFQRSSSGEATLTAEKQVAAEPKLNRPLQVRFIGVNSSP